MHDMLKVVLHSSKADQSFRRSTRARCTSRTSRFQKLNCSTTRQSRGRSLEALNHSHRQPRDHRPLLDKKKPWRCRRTRRIIWSKFWIVKTRRLGAPWARSWKEACTHRPTSSTRTRKSCSQVRTSSTTRKSALRSITLMKLLRWEASSGEN